MRIRTFTRDFVTLISDCQWTYADSSAVFALQIILSVLSLIWIGLQRLGDPPEFYSKYDEVEGLNGPTPLCSLHNVASKNELASFGQLLPLILLTVPLVCITHGRLRRDNCHDLFRVDESRLYHANIRLAYRVWTLDRGRDEAKEYVKPH